MAKSVIPSSGLWAAVAALINGNFTELYDNVVQVGIYDYNDAATATSALAVTANTPTPLPNDAAGPFTNISLGLPGVTNIWDVSTQAFDFSSLPIGTTLDIRLDVEVTMSSPNQEVSIDLVVADGTGGEYSLPFITEQTIKNAGVGVSLLRYQGIYIGDANTRDNPARFKITTSGSSTVVVRGWYARVAKKGLS